MERILPSITLSGAQMLGADGLMAGDIAMGNGLFAEPGPGRRVDLSDYWLLPGIVDVHGDGFERHLAPRRGAMRDLGDGLTALEAELGASGITTAWLAQFWSWEGGMRGPEFAKRLACALSVHPARADLRMQLRLEMGCHPTFEDASALIAANGIDYVVLNDHLPHDALKAGKRPPRLQGQALKAGRSPEAHHALLQEMSDGIEASWPATDALVRRFGPAGVRFGSHDDDSAARRRSFGDRGLTVAEFPMTLSAAQTARAASEPVVMGAPNVVRGGSHKGHSLSAEEVVATGLCTALASDYHYPALLAAVRRLVAGGMALTRAWALVSSGPAAMMGLDDRGRIAVGARADLVVTEPGPGPVCATFAGGRLTYMAGQVLERFL